MRHFGAIVAGSVRGAGWAPMSVFLLHVAFFAGGAYGRGRFIFNNRLFWIALWVIV